MGRHPAFWDEPDEFRPERWLEEGRNGVGRPMPQHQQPPFIPFQVRVRACPRRAAVPIVV
jgi:cytochrome P450